MCRAARRPPPTPTSTTSSSATQNHPRSGAARFGCSARSAGDRRLVASPHGQAERSEGPSTASARRGTGHGTTGRPGRRRHRTAGRWCGPAAHPAARRDRMRRRVLGARDRPPRREPPRHRPRRPRSGRVRSGRPPRRRGLRRLVRRAAPGDVRGAADADRPLAARQPRRALRDRARRSPAPAGRLRGARGRPLPDAAGTPRGGGPVRAAPDRAQRGAVRSLGLLRLRPGPAARTRSGWTRSAPTRDSVRRSRTSSGPCGT